MFGNHFDIFDIEKQQISKGLISTQGFSVTGLYDDDVEYSLSKDVEVYFSVYLSKLHTVESAIETQEAIGFFRKFLVLSYIRTPFFRDNYSGGSWDGLLRDVIKNGIDNTSIEKLKGLVPLLSEGSIFPIKSDDEAEPFLINDRGLTIIDVNNAVYPYSKHEALWITVEHNLNNECLRRDEVFKINSIILRQAYACVGLPSLDENVESILSYRKDNPGDKRYGKLFSMAERIGSSAVSEQTRILREKCRNELITVPEDIQIQVGKCLTMECLGQLSQKHDYKTLSALAVLERYGVADIPVSAKQLIQESISRESLDQAIDRYGDHAESEFEKYCLVEFLEIASDRGIGQSSDRLYRFYSKGKHVIKDPEKAEMYFRRACEQGWTDSLVVFYKSLRNNPDYRSSIHRYDIPENGIACQAVADVYRCHGDEQEYLHWLEKAARLGYGGAITTWVKYWINQEPLDLKKIESMTDIILERQTDAVKVMAEFYLRNSTLCPGKFEWFIGELKKRKNVFYSQLQEEYGKRGISI